MQLSIPARSFLVASDAISKINGLFEIGCTPSSAYRGFLCGLRKICENELDFHIKKVDRSITPRRRDFNNLYKKYCLENFGGKDCAEMFEKLGEKIEQFLQMEPESCIKYSTYDADEDSPFILAIVTPLMQRVHTMVSRTFSYQVKENFQKSLHTSRRIFS